MKARLAWAGGGFVLVALLVYRFLTRVPSPDVAAAGVPVETPAGPAAPPAATPASVPAEPAPAAAAAPPTELEPLAPVFPFTPPSPETVEPARAPAPILTLAPAPVDEPADEPPVAAVSVAPGAPDAPDAAQDNDDVAEGDPDERIEALRRKLEEARGGSAAGEPPLDDRRRSVHDAGRSAAEAMRRTVEHQARPEDAATPAEPPVPGDDGPATG